LVENAKRIAGKSLKGKYLDIVKDLKVDGFDSKVAELESARVEILQLN
jgi:hypothetical protein